MQADPASLVIVKERRGVPVSVSYPWGAAFSDVEVPDCLLLLSHAYTGLSSRHSAYFLLTNGFNPLLWLPPFNGLFCGKEKGKEMAGEGHGGLSPNVFSSLVHLLSPPGAQSCPFSLPPPQDSLEGQRSPSEGWCSAFLFPALLFVWLACFL